MGTTGDADGSPVDADRPLRRDAARNRALILEKAAEVFAERGLDAGYDEIARRACVGVGTVYRRFPERDELVLALFESRIEGIIAVAEESAALRDPWEALTSFLSRAIEQQVADRGLKEAMFAAVSSSKEHTRLGRDRLGPLLEELVQRAKDAGVLRPDVEAADLGVVLMLVSSVTTPDVPGLWRRYLALLLDGLRARPGLDPLPLEAPDDDTVPELMQRLHGR